MTEDRYYIYDNNPQLNTIIFYSKLSGEPVEVLRIAKEGITANPDVPVDAAAAAVIRALDGHIKNLTQRTWVGLTYEDMVKLQKDLYDAKGESVLPTTFAMAVEAKLKEKNK